MAARAERRAFTAADLRAVASTVQVVSRPDAGADDVLRAVDALVGGVEALSLWTGEDGREASGAPVHLGRVEPAALSRALRLVGGRGRCAFTLLVWRGAADPPFGGVERDLLEAVAPMVAAALSGRRPASAAVHRDVEGALRRAERDGGARAASARDVLTAREERVGALVAMGRSNAEVAHELGLSEHTVKQHLKSIYRKLGVRGRIELALRLARGG